MNTPAETIHAWLSTNRRRGFTHVTLLGPGATTPVLVVVLAEDVDLTGVQVLEAAREDALDVTGTPTYRLTAREPNGPGLDSLPVRVAGGRQPDAGLVLPEAREITTANATVGHLVRLCVAKDAQLAAMVQSVCTMATEMAKDGRSEAKDLRIAMQKLRAGEKKYGAVEVDLRKLEYEREDKASEREFWKSVVESVKPLAAGLVAGGLVKRLPAGGATSSDDASAAAVDAIFESLSEDQARQIFALLGPDRAARLLRARGPGAVDALALVAHACIADGTMPALLEVFSTNQKIAFGQVLKAWSAKNKAKDAGTNGAAGPAAPAPSSSDAKEGASS